MTSETLYDRIGIGYARHRRPDERIAARLREALGDSRSVVNVGAGAGSYEPRDRHLVAVEPSSEMVRQRKSPAPAVRASADALPLRDGSFDAAMAILTIHHWPDWRRGLAEMRRTARERVVLLTWDPEHPGFWLVQDYFPEILEIDRRIFPTIPAIESQLGAIEVRTVPIPADCSDGFLGAYWRRPERYLDDEARGAISTFTKLRDTATGLQRLRADLADGRWESKHGAALPGGELDIGYRLLVAGR